MRLAIPPSFTDFSTCHRSVIASHLATAFRPAAGYCPELAQQSSHDPAQSQTETQASGSPRPIAATHSARQVAAQILQQSILQSVWGPPAYCVVRQSVTLFDKQLNGVGKYVRGGQGSGKLKFDLHARRRSNQYATSSQ
ncbi:MAG: hypothetical protein R3C56_42620 [Pirellulaceae bacterium]